MLSLFLPFRGIRFRLSIPLFISPTFYVGYSLFFHFLPFLPPKICIYQNNFVPLHPHRDLRYAPQHGTAKRKTQYSLPS